MITALDLIFEFIKDVQTEERFVNDKLLCRAVTMELLGFSELVKKTVELGTISDAGKPWNDIVRFRDRTSHWYHNTDFVQVYRIVRDDLPKLYEYLKQVQQEEDKISDLL